MLKRGAQHLLGCHPCHVTSHVEKWAERAATQLLNRKGHNTAMLLPRHTYRSHQWNSDSTKYVCFKHLI